MIKIINGKDDKEKGRSNSRMINKKKEIISKSLMDYEKEKHD
jgi:hypothetical protein